MTANALDLTELRKRYARQLENPHLRRLGSWRIDNDDIRHDDNAYKARLEATAETIHLKTEEALKDM